MTRTGALVIAALLAGVGVVRGQAMVPLQRPSGEVGVEGAGLWVGFPGETGLGRFDSWQWFELRLGGAVWNPRLLSFHLGIRPQWRQTALSGLPEPTDQSARWWGWNAGADILANSPLSASVNTVRSLNTLRAGFGTETRQYFTTGNARVRYHNPYLPLDLEYRAEDRDEYWLVGPRDWRGQRLALDVLRFTAQNSKTAVTLERNWIGDRATGASFVLDRDELRHTLRWGKGSRLGSRVGYLKQTGTRPYTVLSWTEGSHLQHTRSISTDWRVDLGSQQVAGNDVGRRLLDGSVTYQLAPGLRAAAAGTSKVTAYSGGRENLRQARSRVDYRATWLPGVTVNTGLSLGYEWRGLEPTSDGWVTVASEQHVVDASGRFALNNALVDLNSLVVSRSDRTVAYELGLDYQYEDVVPAPEIVVLPGGRIALGDTVLVDYRYQPFPSVQASGVTGGYDVNLNLYGFEVYHRRTWRVIGRDAGASTGGEDVRAAAWLGEYGDVTVGVRFSGRTSAGELDLGVERVARSIGSTYRAATSRLRGGLTANLFPAVRATLAGSVSRTTAEPSGALTMLSASSTVSWFPLPALHLQGTLATWTWSQDALRRNQFLGGDGELAWRPGQLSVALRYSRNVWRDGSDRTDDRLSLRVVRGF